MPPPTDVDADTAMSANANNSDLIDPLTTDRVLHREPTTGIQREIWRPGDKEGDQSTDYFEYKGPPLPLASKWRLFQSDIGPISQKNHPPRFVLLDDRAANEVLRSDIPKSRFPTHWPHDFGGPGKVRARRPHRGRPAIKDPNAEGDARYYSTMTGKNDIYYFTGEKDYQPINYRYIPPPPPEPPKVKRKPQKGDIDYNPRAHGHNQYTPKDMLVKHGAASFSEKEQPKRKTVRINSFLRNEAEPEYARDRLLLGGYGDASRSSVAREQDRPLMTREEGDSRISRERSSGGENTSEASSDSMGFRSSLRNVTNADSLDATGNDEDSDEELFPRPAPRQSVEEVLATVDVPRTMGYVERQASEEKLAARTIASLQSQEDVKRISTELSQAIIKNQQQAQQIEKLDATVAAQEEEIQALKQALASAGAQYPQYGQEEEEDSDDAMV